MIDLLTGFKALANTFKGLAKGTIIELFIDYYHDDLIMSFRLALSHIKPKEVPDFVRNGKALPIPPQFFEELKGLEDYLEKIEPQRLFKWINEASPEIGEALMELGDDGAEYMVKLKSFIIDSIRALPSLAEEEGVEKEAETEMPSASEHVRLTCDECGQSWIATEEEAAATTECPFCGEAR